MEKFCVPFNIARELKELGFKEECYARYEYALTSQKDPEYPEGGGPFGWTKSECNFRTEYFVNGSSGDYSNKSWLLVGAPFYDQVIEWFIEKHSLDISVAGDSTVNEILGWDWTVYGLMSFPKLLYTDVGRSRKEALNAALEKAIQIVKERIHVPDAT